VSPRKEKPPQKKSGKMVCTRCQVEMNRHAEKLVDATSPEEAARMDPVLGGIIEEVHACPECGHGGSRRLS
jgi:ribosomal protein S27AE